MSDAPRREEEAVQKDSDSTNDIDALEAPQPEPIISETEAEKHFDGTHKLLLIKNSEDDSIFQFWRPIYWQSAELLIFHSL